MDWTSTPRPRVISKAAMQSLIQMAVSSHLTEYILFFFYCLCCGGGDIAMGCEDDDT